jgi:type I restriction enzyme, S subunit
MELTKAKYKKTEVGLIPEEWKVIPLNECLIESLRYGIGAAAVDFNTTHPTYLRITDIDDNGTLIKRGLKSVNHPESEKYYIEDGEIVFARTGASVGKSYLYDPKDGKLVYAGFLIKAKPNPTILIPIYLKAFVSTKQYWRWINIMSMRSGQPGINSAEYGTLQIPIPPTLEEQKAIASALSDVDDLINKLEKLIAKKKAIKQGAMQQLLTPPNRRGKRLAGFSGEWETKLLGEIGKCIIGLTYSPDNVVNDGTLVLRSSNVQENKLAFHDNVYVNSPIPDNLRVKEGDILICVRNGSRQLIGKCAILDKRVEGQTFGAFMSVFRTEYSKFVFQVFQSNDIKRQIDENLGATINQITNKVLNSFSIPFPPIKEQEAITQILCDMDDEIIKLENKRDKYICIKQGMMQELLTGKTRLV